MIETIQLHPGVTLRCFQDNRFKQGILTIQFVRKLCTEEAALNALIPAVLLQGTEKYPDLRQITLHLDDLYGASVGALVRKVGDYQTTGLSCGFVDDRFALEGDRILAPAIDFLRQLLFEPVLEKGCFREDYLESEKRNLIQAIESMRNNKRQYASNQLIRHMTKGDPFGTPRLGEVEQVSAITACDAYSHYQTVLKESPVEIFYVGSAEPDTLVSLLRPLFAGREGYTLPAQTAISTAPTGAHTEELDVTQGKLCMGFVTPITLRDPRFAAMQVLNMLLGGGMTSKLFMQVREKESLCYDIGSGFHGSKGIMLVAAGIEFEKKDIVLQEITRQLQEIVNGNVTELEMAAAKEALLSNLRATHDSPGAIESYYASAAISGIGMTPAVFMERIAQVTIQDVQEAAKTLELCTVYFLKGEG